MAKAIHEPSKRMAQFSVWDTPEVEGLAQSTCLLCDEPRQYNAATGELKSTCSKCSLLTAADSNVSNPGRRVEGGSNPALNRSARHGRVSDDLDSSWVHVADNGLVVQPMEVTPTPQHTSVNKGLQDEEASTVWYDPPPPELTPADQESYDQFIAVKSVIDEARIRIVFEEISLFDEKDQRMIMGAAKQAATELKRHRRALEKYKRAKTSAKRSKRYQVLQTAKEGLQQFCFIWRELDWKIKATMFGQTIHQPMLPENENTLRNSKVDITFCAGTSKSFEAIMKKMRNPQVCLFIGLHHNHWKDHWSYLERNKPGLWECTITVRQDDISSIPYTYAVIDANDSTWIEFEFLEKSSHNDCYRHLDVAELRDTSFTVYDGCIMPRRGALETLGNALGLPWSKAEQEVDRNAAYRQMLPDWAKEVCGAASIESLLLRIASTTKRQYVTLIVPQIRLKRKESVHKALWWYINVSLSDCQKLWHHDHEGGIDGIVLATVAMVGLFHLARTFIEPLERTKADEMANCGFMTMLYVGSRLRAEDELSSLNIRVSKLGTDSFYSSIDETLHWAMNLFSKYDLRWFWLVPLQHIINGVSTETVADNFTLPRWWGTAAIQHILDKGNGCNTRDNPLKDWLDWSVPFYRVDNILPRTLLAVQTSTEFAATLHSPHSAMVEREMPINAVLWRAEKHIAGVPQEHPVRKGLYTGVLNYLNRWKPYARDKSADPQTFEMAGRLLDLYPIVNRKRSTNYGGLEIIVQSYLILMDQLVTSPELATKYGNKLTIFCGQLKTALVADSEKNHFSSIIMTPNELKQWKSLFGCQSHNEHVQKWFSTKSLKVFKVRLDEIALQNPDFAINLHISQELQDFKLMEQFVADVALANAEQLLTMELQKPPTEQLLRKLGQLIDHAIENVWSEDYLDAMILLRRILSWTNFPNIWKFCDDPCLDCIKQETKDKLCICKTALEEIMKEITGSSISISDFEFLHAHLQIMSKLGEVMCDAATARHVEEVFKEKQQRLETFKDFRMDLQTFMQHVRCKIKGSLYDEIVVWNNRGNEELMLADACTPPADHKQYGVIGPNVSEIVPQFCILIRSTVFRAIWEEIRISDGSWEEVLGGYNDATTRYESLKEKLEDGTISVGRLDKIKQSLFANDHQSFLKELRLIIDNEHLAVSSCEQYSQSVQMGTVCQAASSMLFMKDTYNLTGDFSDLENIIQYGNRRLALGRVDEQLLSRISEMKSITTREKDCIDMFVRCKDFLEWIGIEVPRADIGTFVDLVSASNVFGEGSEADVKIGDLLSVLNGYAPLIYALCEQDESAKQSVQTKIGYKELHNLCRRVWRSLKLTPQLPEALMQSGNELALLKQVRNLVGNVEMTAVAQATLINQTGIYYVGNIFKRNLSTKNQRSQDVILLKCKEERLQPDGKMISTDKKYKVSDLRDLQSRLTLVAASIKAKDVKVVEQFEQMLDAVENLAKTYLDIMRSGCIQFDDLLVIVHCDDSDDVVLELKLQTIKQVMVGHRRQKSALEHCEDLYRYLRECATRWKEEITEQRRKHPELDFFTTQQLVDLRKEIGSFLNKQNTECLGKAMPLLSLIHTVDPSQLLQFLNEYKPDEESSHREEPGRQKFLPYERMTPNQKDMVEDIQDMDERYNELLAVQALNELGDSAEEDAFIGWIEDYSKLQCEDQARRTQTIEELMTELHANQARDSDLQEQLNGLWEGFIEGTKHDIKDLLSVPHLAFVLKKVKELGPVKLTSRTLPVWLQSYRGKPCLIPAKEDETYQLILTIYESDKESSTPTRNEVLICHTSTTCQEVALFLERALNDPISYYCMVNCHLLDFEASREIETRLAGKSVENFGLALIYARTARKARVRAYLDKHLMEDYSLANVESLRKYVQEQILAVPETVRKSACQVDKKRVRARLIKSERAGVGKTLQKEKLCSQLRQDRLTQGEDITIPIYKRVDVDEIISRLNSDLGNGYTTDLCHTIHFDIAHEVECGVDEFLFNLLILGSIVDSTGVVWQVQQTQYYIIECMPAIKNLKVAHEILDMLPSINCVTPEQAYAAYSENTVNSIGFDEDILMKGEWQRVVKYLECHSAGDKTYTPREGDFTEHQQALRLLIDNCQLQDPSWSELRHYVHFLNSQLAKVEMSGFCLQSNDDWLPGFREFVFKFMFTMAEDFATRSLKIAEQTPGLKINDTLTNMEMRTWESESHPYLFFNEDGGTFAALGFCFTSIWGDGTCSLIDSQTGAIAMQDCMTKRLARILKEYGMPIFEKFDDLPRHKQLAKLRDIMVKKIVHHGTEAQADGSTKKRMFLECDDPNPYYVLTMDNAMKILAIHQRLRVNIPVIIMGETGCGKTKLIDFMSKLQVPSMLQDDITKTMVTVKVHGGTTKNELIKKVKFAENLAVKNRSICSKVAERMKTNQIPEVYTILFLDEANTTEAIGLVKEILCDGAMDGRPLHKDSGLKIIAACNPYRMHTDEMIQKLQSAGLGYNTTDEETSHFGGGKIPMRHLVYRVQPLSQSLLPLVWDFGTLRTEEVEKAYIIKMIEQCNTDFRELSHAMVSTLLSKTQAFMRKQTDECNFVSLRDIQRLLDVTSWFFDQRQHLFPSMEATRIARQQQSSNLNFSTNIEDDSDGEDDLENAYHQALPVSRSFSDTFYSPESSATCVETDQSKDDSLKRSLLLALGVCYLTRLDDSKRKEYGEAVGSLIEQLLDLEDIAGAQYLSEQIELCQNMFIDEAMASGVHKNIAKNKALKENVLMMIVCIENRIPLYVIGRPGSSKSLSKTIVVDAMRGPGSRSRVFRQMKRIHVVSFQCSKHSTAEGIVGVFNHCANVHRANIQNDIDSFVAVVVLDEVGLAEESEYMPLKALHPLLEDGVPPKKPKETQDEAELVADLVADDSVEMKNDTDSNASANSDKADDFASYDEYVKCGFVGISNWALDPAKMNRGIFVQRSPPDSEDLEQIAREISKSCNVGETGVSAFIPSLARGYAEIYTTKKSSEGSTKDFYGLRDFYSLMKMVSNLAKSTGKLNRNQLEYSIKRNFGGLDFEPMTVFRKHCPMLDDLLPSADGRPPVDPIDLIASSLSGSDTDAKHIDSRYLLILTENLSVLSIIMEKFASHDRQPEVVFGSRFTEDISYTQACHNISRIKTCMSMGIPVVLLNLDDLYESLYDALNQYFHTMKDQKFVDLGLGTHRVKTVVHDKFRLVVVANKEKVYTEFPTPLINRLEKHYISANSLLTVEQRELTVQLDEWAQEFVRPSARNRNVCPMTCDGCARHLNKPYKVSCLLHYICERCCNSIINGTAERRCPVGICSERIPQDYELNEWDQAALENRQYFENSKTETSFIGYSAETSALIVSQVCQDLDSPVERNSSDWKRKVLEDSKFHLLLCATAESVLRLDRTKLEGQAKDIQKIYFEEQYHLEFSKYLQEEMAASKSVSLRIQVTSFAQLMNRTDRTALRERLNATGMKVNVKHLNVTDFRKEDQFTDSMRDYYKKQVDDAGSKLLIIQFESASENSELLDSVRYIIDRELKATDDICHTVLLLNLPRGFPFKGYQGGKWRNVHIDDPRSTDEGLPPLAECLEMKPYDILKTAFIENDPKEPLDDNSRITNFIKGCIPIAVSLVKSGKQSTQLSRIMPLLDNREFTEIFLRQTLKLIEAQDAYSTSNWVKSEAVKASNMKRSETIRHSLVSTLRRKVTSCLAAVLSFIDVQENLLNCANNDYTAMWLQVFSVCDRLGLTFQQLKGQGNDDSGSKLPNSFSMVDVGKGSKAFSARFPFSWIILNTINRLIDAAKGSRSIESIDTDAVIGQFKSSVIGEAILSEDNSPEGDMLDAYIDDFIYMSYPCSSVNEHKVAKQAIQHLLSKQTADQMMFVDEDRTEASDHTEASADDSVATAEDSTPLATNDGEPLGDDFHQKGGASFVDVHLASRKLKPTLDNFFSVVDLQRSLGDKKLSEVDIAEKVVEISVKEQQQSCDFVALRLFLTSLYESVLVKEMRIEPDSWVRKVEKSKPIVSKIIKDADSTDVVDQCRRKWLDVQLKKLFAQHVIAPSNPDPKTGQRGAFGLAFFLRKMNGVAFCKQAMFDAVKESLRKSVLDGFRKIFDNCPSLCPGCGDALELRLVRLPCGHLLCAECIKKRKWCSTSECTASVPEDFQYDPEADLKEREKLKLKDIVDLQKRLNTFFMYFVSEIIFGTANKPTNEILEWLTSCVMADESSEQLEATNQQFSIFYCTDVVDKTPVLRSFLLKLLLQSDQRDTVTHLLDETMSTWQSATKRQLYTADMIISCQKVLFSHRHPRDVATLQRVLSGEQMLRHLAPMNQPTANRFAGLAYAQNVLSSAVEQLTNSDGQYSESLGPLDEALNGFLQQAKDSGNRQPGYYVIQQLFASYGGAYVNDMLRTPRCYMISQDIQERFEFMDIPDIMDIFGEEKYKMMKSVLANALMVAKNSSELDNAFNDLTEISRGNAGLLIFSIFAKVTRAMDAPVSSSIRSLILEKLSSTLSHSEAIILRMLLEDGKMPLEISVSSCQGVNMAMLMLHMFTSLSGVPRSHLLYPWAEIILHPQQAAEHFLPTMPDNEIEAHWKDIRGAFLDPDISYYNPTMYLCPNGHPYVIADCGRPVERNICTWNGCGKPIGSQENGSHTYATADGNQVLDPNTACSKHGHILGQQSERPPPMPMRDLGTLSNAIVRCITHICMYVASLLSPQQAMSMIKPSLSKEQDICPFIHAHILLDLEHISRFSGQSTADSILLVHDVIHGMSAAADDQSRGVGQTVALTDIGKRKEWEAEIDQTHIQPTISNQSVRLQNITKELRKDNVGLESVLAELLSIGNAEETNIITSPMLWRYRKPLTIFSVEAQVRAESSTCPNLLRLLSSADMLLAVQRLPDVIHLTQTLSNDFYSKYKRDELQGLTIADFIARYGGASPGLAHLVDNFKDAWNVAITSPTWYGSQETTRVLSTDSQITEMIYDKHASRENTGSAPLRLIGFLVDVHNGMLSENSKDENRAQMIQLSDVNHTNVVGLSSEDDVLMILMAHSEHGLGPATDKVTYNWAAIEQEISARYISNKPKIEYTLSQIPCFVYRDDFNLNMQLKNLRDTQEHLSTRMESSLESRLVGVAVNTLEEYLNDLEVIINFMSTMPHADGRLAELIGKTFPRKATPPYLSDDIQLKHVKHVWMTLKYTQTDHLMIRNEEPFDDVAPSYNETMSDEMVDRITELCPYQSAKTKLLLLELLEFILLALNKEAINQNSILPESPLIEGSLYPYIALTDGEERWEKIEDDLPKLPDSIQAQHASQAWCHIWKCYAVKSSTPAGTVQPPNDTVI